MTGSKALRTHLAVLTVAAALTAAASLNMAEGAAYLKQPRQAIRVGTYNIRNSDGDRWTRNSWWCRKDDLLRLIGELRMDVFGLQEVLPDQLREIDATLTGYGREGTHRGKDRVSGEATPVYFSKERFERLAGGTFWLSERPEEPGSESWDTACTRICTWVRLKDRRDGGELVFVNTHLDHRSERARVEGVKLILSRMEDMAPKGVPVVFAGDHNCGEGSAAERLVGERMCNALRISRTPPSGAWRTFNAWEARDPEPSAAEVLANPRLGRGLWGRIDHVWVSKGVRVLSCETRSDFRPGTQRYPSDHFPVVVELVP